MGAALRFPGAADPASFHELVTSGRPYGFSGGDSTQRGTHLLMAETAAAALADVPPAGRPGASRTGVIIAGLPASDVTSRVAGQLGFAAAGETPPTCSLRAVAAACELLSAGQLDLVLAGGVSEGIDPARAARWTPAGPPAGEDMRVYDVSPTGTVPGEGRGVVALMRAPAARAAGLGVYAEIAGWHAADDGTAPSAAVRDAYLRSGIDPADVQYVEGHGAATAVDDLAELTALLDVLAPRHDGTLGGCALGSVTANIGDTGAAAGVAALLKTALAMTSGIVPPTAGCVRPHQLLRAGAAPFRLPSAPEPWPEVTTRLAAVNTLGTADFTASTRSGPVHLVLRRDVEPVRPAGRRRRRSPSAARTPLPASGDGWHIDTATGVSAAHSSGAGPTGSPSGSRAAGSRRAGAARAAGAGPEFVIGVRGADLGDLAVTLDTIAMAADRLPAAALGELALEMAAVPAFPGLRARAAMVARDPAQLAGRARAAAAAAREWPRGPGAPGPGAGRMRAAGAGGAGGATGAGGAGSYVSSGAAGRVALLFPGLVSTGAEHSAVLSASMATLGTAERLGLRPRLAVGYSFGEIAGLAWAGMLTFGEAARLAAHRAEIIRATPGRAAMARVHAGPQVVAGLCRGTGLTVAAHEGPEWHVLAGPVPDIRELPRRAAETGAEAEVLGLAHGLHSPAMRPSAAPMRAVVDELRFARPRQRLISTVTGLDVTSSADPAGLVAGQLTRPALLAGALALARADADVILMTARDPALAAIADEGSRVPVVRAPLDQFPGTAAPSALAAFFAAGAIDSLLPFLPGGPAGPLIPRQMIVVPRQAAGEPAARAADGSQSGRSGMPDRPSAGSLTPRI